jgi:hypothetical protein
MKHASSPPFGNVIISKKSASVVSASRMPGDVCLPHVAAADLSSIVTNVEAELA